MTNIEEIAKGLSSAQLYTIKRLLGKNEKRDPMQLAAMLVGAVPLEPKPPRASIQALERKGLASSIYCGGWIDHLTDTGLAVRKYLMEND